MNTPWLQNYLSAQRGALETIDCDEVARIIERMKQVLADDAQMFVIGNGGSAASASHFATDLGKGASDVLHRRFRILSLTDNLPWITALGNDYAYEDVFVRQLENFGRSGDLLLAISVSGNSPNLVKACEWANEQGLTSVVLVGGKRGRLAELAEHVIVVDSEHYGRVEDAHMTVCHMLAYAFMEDQIDVSNQSSKE
ncbi:MAG: sugar isomerase [Planctomycetaceae bacterium]|nr:sugar isomerase [Planctomycetaceae bacterium]